MPFSDIRTQLAGEIARLWNHPEITPEWVDQEFSFPPNPQMGHLALPCFKVAKVLRRPTNELAAELVKTFTRDGLTVSAAGPYANFRWAVGPLYEGICQRVFAEKDRYGGDSSGAGKRVLIEFCSPNIAKKLGVQHIRTTLIGNVLANIYEALGYPTDRMNFVGDWGSQFARLLAAVELWGDASVLSSTELSKVMDHLFELYVKFHQAAEQDPSYLERASKCLQLLEEGDAKTTALWKKIRDLSLAAAERTLDRLQVRFNIVEGESHYIPEIQKTLEEVKSKAEARLSEGAWIVDVEGLQTPALIQKKDGTTLYLTRDIAAAVDRHKRFGFHKMYYVVSEQQKLHFQLLFGVLKKMGHSWADKCEHLSFGTVLFGAEKMSTREGRVIFLDSLLDEARERALVECSNKNPALENKGEVAEMVGTGAVIFGDLSVNRQRDIEFNWEHVLAFDGETGPYIQYSLVRCQSLLQKARDKGLATTLEKAPAGYVFAEEEEALTLVLGRLRATLHTCVRDNDPVHLTRYLVDLARALNKFYYQLPVLQATDPVQCALRLSLVEATRQTLANGLKLLGMGCPKEM
ncbi:arginine--tRNA ligase [bacterium]|nr:arginine--tRNA ligase [bacterium]